MKKFLCGLCMAGALTMFSGITTSAEAQEVRKSRKGKYTAIGAAAGAGTGVAVSKNNSKGAVIGGVVGAGTGYMIGKKKDKKYGRKRQ